MDKEKDMVTERKWLGVAPQLFTSDGTAYGVIETTLACLFKVGMTVILRSDTQPDLILKIRRIVDTRIEVSKPTCKFNEREDVSAYLVADNATIEAQEQDRSSISGDEVLSYVYSREPAMALRTLFVDECGNPYNTDNPLPISVDDVIIENIDVKLKHNGEDPQPNNGDTIAIGNNKTGADSRLATITSNDDDSKNGLDVVGINAAIDVPFDDVEVTAYTDCGQPETVEVREGGNLKRTLTLTYNADGEFQRLQRT